MIKISAELVSLRDKAFQATARCEESAYVTDVIISAIAKTYSGIHPSGVTDEVADFIVGLRKNYGIVPAVNIAVGLYEIGVNV